MIPRMVAIFGAVLLAASALMASVAANAAEATAPDAAGIHAREVLDRLVGRWVLTGTIAGQRTTHDVDAAWVLQGKYVRISEISRERGAGGLPAYEATILVGWLKDRYVCFWFDNTEVASPGVTCQADVAADSIPLEFRDAKGALIFTNAFSHDRAADTWQWRMSNVAGGKAALFGLVTLRRR